MTECSYTPQQIRTMTMDDFQYANRYWEEYPSHGDLLYLLARLWGWKPTHRAEPQMIEGEFKAALAATGDMFKAPRRWFPNG